MANMKEIARMARVSLGTVSHVLNNSANVRDPLRARVLEAVAKLGYQPSQLARGLRRDKTNMIGMIIPDITNPFFPYVVRGAEDVAFASGYRLILCNTDNDHAKELAHLSELRTYLPAGLIIIPSVFGELASQAESFHRSGTAVVCVDRLPKNWEGDSVIAANEQAAYDAARYLINLGHQHLAVISGPKHLTNSRDRVDGLKRAMKEAHLRLAPEFIQEATFDRLGGYTKTKVLLRLRPRPTAILACNDLIAFGAMIASRDAGLACPRDVSIFGFDDLDLAEMTNPPLSCVHQCPYQMGATAAQILVDRVGGDDGPAHHVVLPAQLTLRESAAGPPELEVMQPPIARALNI